MECIFCKIIKGEVFAHKIFENETVYVFLDIHPVNPGHTLIVPKKHVANYLHLDNETYLETMKVAKEISSLINLRIKPPKVGLAIAGWDVPHTHIHVIPMFNYHDITSKSLLEGNKANPSIEELTKIQTLLIS